MKNNQETIDKYLKNWNLSNPEFVDVESACSDVFIVTTPDGEKAALKIRYGRGIEAEKHGADALNYFKGHGIVKLYKYDDQAHLLEYVDGQMLKSIVDNGNDDKATRIICDVVEELHSSSSKTPPQLKSLENHCAELFKQACLAGASDTLKEAARIGRELLNNQTDIRLLHGDVHHENILMSSRGWLLIDPNGLVGDPVYEFANTFNNPINDRGLTKDVNRINSMANIISSKTGYSRTKILRYAAMHMGLSASWSLSSGDDVRANETIDNCRAILKLVK